ncbi:MAG: hypothetical protein ACI8P9_003351 [Parasphingorhabdus sp.]|jgi:hypothetical protein
MGKILSMYRVTLRTLASSVCAGAFLGLGTLASLVDANEIASPLNGTGILYGGDYPKGINTTCITKILSDDIGESPSKAFLLQQGCATGDMMPDGSFFSYQKVSLDGVRLSDGAKQWYCVIDDVSGLMWEVKQTENTHGDYHLLNDKFTWYNSNTKTNGGNIGTWNRDGASCHGYSNGKLRSYCHVEQFVSRVNKQGLCGFHDWRLPVRAELTSLIHFGRLQPAIDISYFPNTLNSFYWAMNPVAGRAIEAWAINFEFGFASPLRKTDLRPARLVRLVNEQ